MGIPKPAIANKMRAAGVDASVISKFEETGEIKGKPGIVCMC